MRLNLLQVGEPVLRERARPLSHHEIASPRIRDLIASMHETLRAAPGVGLAAPQIGEGIQLAIIEDLAEYMKEVPEDDLAVRERRPVPFHVIINPRITSLGEEKVEFFEGCLSLSGFVALVPRARKITVECLDEHGEERTVHASGWYARILQHEIDHLNGTIYIDRMDTRTFACVDNYKRYSKNTVLANSRTS
ncbi:MAG TPA: peptide deformylase [Terriglobales bacterium]|nr:peptide deformylase [Terriglobales bacterium]